MGFPGKAAVDFREQDRFGPLGFAFLAKCDHFFPSRVEVGPRLFQPQQEGLFFFRNGNRIANRRDPVAKARLQTRGIFPSRAGLPFSRRQEAIRLLPSRIAISTSSARTLGRFSWLASCRRTLTRRRIQGHEAAQDRSTTTPGSSSKTSLPSQTHLPSFQPSAMPGSNNCLDLIIAENTTREQRLRLLRAIAWAGSPCERTNEEGRISRGLQRPPQRNYFRKNAVPREYLCGLLYLSIVRYGTLFFGNSILRRALAKARCVGPGRRESEPPRPAGRGVFSA